MQQKQILTINGFKDEGSICVGDILKTKDNTESVVTQVVNELTDVYRVTFQDGRQLDVGEDQLWDFHPAGDVRQKVKPTTFLKSILDNHATKAPHARKRIPIVELSTPLSYKFAGELSVAPYTLGAILGDGHITKRGHAAITNLDTEIIDRVQRDGYDTCNGKPKSGTEAKTYFVYGIGEALRGLKLDGTLSATKFIPPEYKTASIEDRYALVQGLMDTDGYVCARGNTYYDTVSPHLAQGLTDILRSLGYTATISTKVGSYKKDGIHHMCQLVYKLYIRGLNQSKLFSMKRKVDRCKEKTVGIRVEKIEPLGQYSIPKITLSNKTDTMISNGFIPLLSH